MNKFDLQKRTMQFHVDVIKLCGRFPKNAAGFETAKQLIRSAGSVGANYRAACRAKSKADWIFKIEIVLEEADESLYWMQASKAANLVEGEDLEALIKESNELVSIFTKTDITSKRNRDAAYTKNRPQNHNSKKLD
ncbi:four helix bundle protein [Longitalea luteola]|uniref:four helix bundle protein n=1 Tax=Longitalea luteola TaxID=2812563 RepID=UPI001A95644B|nr:four helix bundle protein [Longitalea luteola]